MEQQAASTADESAIEVAVNDHINVNAGVLPEEAPVNADESNVQKEVEMIINASADDVVMQDVESGGDEMGVYVAVGDMSNSSAAAANDTANTPTAAASINETNEIDAKDTDNQDQSGEPTAKAATNTEAERNTQTEQEKKSDIKGKQADTQENDTSNNTTEETNDDDDDRKEEQTDQDDEASNTRRTKRRRSSIIFSRYSPGEGGGLKRQKVESSPEAVKSSSQVLLKSDATGGSSNVGDKAEPKKKDKEIKKRYTAKTFESSSSGSNKHQYPIYSWTSASTTKSTNRIIHTSLSIDFGPFAEDTTSLIDKDGSWKCSKCYHTNIPTKSRCGVCLSWKGGKRENYPRRGSDHSSVGGGGGGGGGTAQPVVISVGDDVLISSGDTPWKDLNKLQDRAGILKNKDEGDVSICYADPASNEPGLAVLDPYVARIEGMWEEIDEKKKGQKSLESRMMIQTRWYFKKEDMEGLKLSMDGESNVQDRIASDMTVRDLILSDQIDLNGVSCVLGKANVSCLSMENKQKVKGGFVCRYKMDLDPEDGATGSLFPMVDSSVDAADSQSKERRGSDAHTGASSEEETTTYRAETLSAYGASLSPRRVISEGPTVGKIKVGPDHQAVIPQQLDLEKKLSSRHLAHPPLDRTPMLVWDPKQDGVSVDSFVASACAVLSKNMPQPFHEINHVESAPDPVAEANKPREISIDNLLTQLHECKYDSEAALGKVSAQPEKFLTLWNQDERDQFDSSFRLYRDSLRMISKNLVDMKSCKDVVEYHYRFKLVENFRRFKAKKQEQAREMMETVEYRMLKEKKATETRSEMNSSDENMSDSDGEKTEPEEPSTKDGPLNSRIRTWFKTGCSKDGSEGAVQRRRNTACNFLIEVKDKVGPDAYLALAKCLKSYSQSQSLMDLRASAYDIMKSHPTLFDQFMEFLPKEIC